MPVNSLLSQIEQDIRSRELLCRGQPVLVAVSGGVDSMVLLEVLGELAPAHDWQLAVAHFNHQLRGAASDADETFVAEAAARRQLPFHCERGEVKAFQREHKLSLEMAARKLRHEFLARTARHLSLRSVALGHHADDQVELFFLRLLRGAGGVALGGIQLRSPSPADSRIELVRPLLGCSKAKLLAYAMEQGIAFREDASNAQLEPQRNRLRHEILPRLQQLQPNLPSVIRRQMEIISQESDCARQAAQDWLKRRRRAEFDRLHPAIQRQCLHWQLQALGVEPDFGLVEQLRPSGGRRVSVGPNRTVWRDAGGRLHGERTEPSRHKAEELAGSLNGGSGSLGFGGIEIEWRRQKAGQRLPSRRPGTEYFDAGKIGTEIVLRHWRQGDRFQPIGMSAPVKLQDLFTNLKIPRAERHQRVLATTAAGALFWVEGLRISEEFKLDKATKRQLKWQWRPTGTRNS